MRIGLVRNHRGRANFLGVPFVSLHTIVICDGSTGERSRNALRKDPELKDVVMARLITAALMVAFGDGEWEDLWWCKRRFGDGEGSEWADGDRCEILMQATNRGNK